MSYSARLLVPGDEASVDNFLKPHTPFAFFIRSNLKKSGFRYEGKAYQADVFGAFMDGNLAGILSHSWMNSVQLYAADPSAISALVEAFRAFRLQNPRIFDRFLGPAEQIGVLLPALGLGADSFLHGGETEGLYALSLDKMVLPALLNKPEIQVRHAEKQDEALLISWRHDFNVEENGAPPGQKTTDDARDEITRRIDERDLFVLEDRGEVVSFCGIGGFLSDWMNVGPVWTPPDKRSLGYARSVTAGALSILREEGLANAVLFARLPAAIKAYQAIGFERRGDWMFDFLKKPVDRL